MRGIIAALTLIFLMSAVPHAVAWDYYGPAAVKYAETYAYTLCDCGITYAPPVSGGDCCHYTSHCLEAGGISNRGSSYATDWLENPGLIVSTSKLREWFQETGVATQVYSIQELQPGDVVLYMPGSAGINHATLYLGLEQVASHTSEGIFHYMYFGTPELWHINAKPAFSKDQMVEVQNTLSSGLTVRNSPAGTAIGSEMDGNQGVVLEDNPTAELLDDGKVFIWWKIRWNDGLVGWSAQNYPGGDYYLKKVTASIQNPTANFYGNPVNGEAPLTVQFIDQSTDNPKSWLWDFGDGSPADLNQNPSHTYQSPGEYRVRLTVANTAGSDVEEKTNYITVNSPIQVPTANFYGNPTNGEAPLTVQFTDQSIGNPNSWLWDFGDGSPADLTQNPSHTYTSPGNYRVRLTVANTAGSDVEEKMGYINVISLIEAPQAQFSANIREGQSPLTVQFSDASSGNPTSWLWNFGDGCSSTEKNPSHKFTTPGIYTVKLTATNTAGEDFEDKEDYIEVVESFQEPKLILSPQSQVIPIGTTGKFTLFIDSLPEGLSGYNLSIALLNPAVGEIIDYSLPEWANLNSTSQSGNSLQFSGVDLARKIEAGAMDVTLGTVTVRGDAIGHSLMELKVLEMDTDGGNPLQPTPVKGELEVYEPVVANFTATNQIGEASLTVQFVDQSLGNPSSWNWLFGDGSESNEQNPEHTYTQPGQYTVTLDAMNPYGVDRKTRIDLITVIVPVAPFPGHCQSPNDLDKDGLFEDINGNNRSDFDDVVVFYYNMHWIRQNPEVGINPFDYNGNGRIDYADVVLLFWKVTS